MVCKAIRPPLSPRAMELWAVSSTAGPGNPICCWNRDGLARLLKCPAQSAINAVLELHEAGYIRYKGYIRSSNGQLHVRFRLIFRAKSIEELMAAGGVR